MMMIMMMMRQCGGHSFRVARTMGGGHGIRRIRKCGCGDDRRRCGGRGTTSRAGVGTTTTTFGQFIEIQSIPFTDGGIGNG